MRSPRVNHVIVALSLALVSCAEPTPGDIAPELSSESTAPHTATQPPVDRAGVQEPMAEPTEPSDDLPLGRWTAGMSELCVDVLPNRMIRISVKTGGRNPDVIEASYHATRTAESAWRLVLDVRAIHRKVLGRCRSRWVDDPLDQSKVLGVELRRGERASLTVQLAADRRKLEVCAANGECRELEGNTTERRCSVFGRNIVTDGFADPFVSAGGRSVPEDDDDPSWPSSSRRAPEDATGTVVARDAADGFEATCGEIR